jgi:hypothetical protein
LPDKPERPQQQQTLSVRISEALRMRLERAKQLMSSRTGESVSTSEIAKQLLESAREDRLEVVDLIADPTKTLLEIRRKGEADHLLSKAEWSVLAHFVQQGLEAFSGETPNPVSRESVNAVLDAFLSVYELRKGPSTRDQYYLGNLPLDYVPAKDKGSERPEKGTPELVRRTVLEARRRLNEPKTKYSPLFSGRNLCVLLEEEHLSGVEALNRALRPYWLALWRLAARGHYYLTKEPIREKGRVSGSLFQPPIPSLSEGGYTLSFARGQGNDFSVLLSFPEPRAPMYPLGSYPILAEFRAMLAALDPEGSTPSWEGVRFYGYLVEREQEKEYWFRAHENGITFGFSEKDWTAVRELFRRAWEIPDLRTMWNGLILEYGEL